MEFKHGNITLIHGDCMEYMGSMEWKADLAIVDPPYGIGFSDYQRGTILQKSGNRYKSKDWDNEIPKDSYFNEVFRVSQNQIIWGGNYFPILWHKGCKGFIFWYKHQPVDNFSKGELAWTSFDKVANCFNYPYYGNINSENRLHPTQKPVVLYKWLLTNYAKKGDRIIDTHGGSMSIAIACYDLGFELVCIEKDLDYFNAAVKRFKQHIKQAAIQFPEQTEQPTQSTLQL